MNKNVWIGVGVVVVLLVIIGAVIMNRPEQGEDQDNLATDQATQDDTTGQEYATTSPSLGSDTVSTTPVTSPTAVTGQVKEFPVTASEFKFSPTEIRVKKGDMVKITLTNDGQMPHDWRVDEFNAKTKTINGGQTDTVEFTADTAGTFEYYCSVGQHRKLGMVGKLIVE